MIRLFAGWLNNAAVKYSGRQACMVIIDLCILLVTDHSRN